MAYFGRKPKKPGSVPGAASGGPERRAVARLTGIVRQATGERQARPGRALRNIRQARSERGAR